MDISQLEVFLAVAREGGFSRAADKLYRTQSAVSQSVRKLEAEIGEPLFDRSSREGLLTDAGRVLQDYAERLINLRENAREALTELRELQMGKLVVGANELTALYLLRVMGEFRRLHPAIRIVVHRSLGSQLPDDIRRHKCEFAVLTYEPHDPELASVVVYSDELIFVVPPQHPLARESRVSIRQLGAESFVAHIVPSPYRDKVIQAFEKYKTPLHMGVELPTLQAIKRFVALGNGVAFLPEISVEDEIARGDLVRIPVQELSVHRKLRLIHRKTGTLSHAGRAFLKVAESVAHNQGGRYRFQREKIGVPGDARRGIESGTRALQS
ncbi:MAG: LysR family transcriptional regulator [Acidobacteria bacterium]|nr:MAG: LysR family transcriptional regulator [Acidobacteriota bacterium]PYV79066.1 MAG: LysR family transcriptional regulator [Acidobacteriota bacterium]